MGLRRRLAAALGLSRPRQDVDRSSELEALRRELSELGARLEALEDRVHQAEHTARGASQQAARATTTAEAAVDAVSGLEIDLLSRSAPAEPGPLVVAEGVPSEEPSVCRVPACGNKARRRGFCGRHYDRLRSGELPGFVDPEGVARTLEGLAFRVSAELVGREVELRDGDVVVDGVIVHAQLVDAPPGSPRG